MQQLIDFCLRHWELCLAFVAILIVLAGTELRGRLTGFKAVSPQEATFLINREDALVLDLRTDDLFTKGHIVNAINIPLVDLVTKLGQLAKFKGKPLILVVNGTQAPTKVDALLEEGGFSKICYLQGGMAAWQSASFPVVKGNK
jgi:rhodanese-related sulfurtransferase